MASRILLFLSFFFTILHTTIAQEAEAPALSFSICEASFEPDSGWQRVQVCMFASDSGAFHSRGQIYLKVEGKSLVGIPDSAIIVRPLELIGTPVEGLPMARYETINVLNTGNSIVITWQAKMLGQAGNARLHSTVPTKPTGLYEILIPAKSPLAFALDPNLMRGQAFYITEDDKMEKPFKEGEWE
ncbi:MAG: hypothetical protein AB8F95_04445 [Bacteroidia bacterium]